MASEPNKRRKIDEPPSLGIRVASDGINSIAATSANVPMVAFQTNGINFTVQQAKHFAATQARQDGRTGNYRIFDSPFGNFLVPVVPTRAELAQ